MMPDKIRILLVDDQRLMREGLRTLLELEPDLQVAGEAGDGQAGMRERVLALGGSIDFGSRPGGGFRVQAVLPSHDDTVVPVPRKGTRP